MDMLTPGTDRPSSETFVPLLTPLNPGAPAPVVAVPPDATPLRREAPPEEKPTPPSAPAAAGAALPSKAARYQSLDVWRGAACLSLVVFHATMQVATADARSSGGWLSDWGHVALEIIARAWIGVPIFFVISGYCIMATLDSRRRKPGNLTDYFKRRFLRIYPPYWTALVLSVVTVAVVETWLAPGLLHDGIFTVPEPWRLSGWQWFGNLTLTETWRHCLGGGQDSLVLPNTWTLCYEEQFYAVAGLLLFLAPRRIFLATAITTAISIVIKVVTHLAGISLHGFFIDGRWLLIAAGIMVYYRINYAKKWEGNLIHLALLAGMLLADRHPSNLLAHMPNHGIERLVGFGYALFISLTYRWDSRIMRIKWLTPLAACGAMSYSIYLIHPLVTKAISHGLFLSGFRGPWQTLLVTAPLCLATSLACAWCFYRLVERRFQSGTARAAAKAIQSAAVR